MSKYDVDLTLYFVGPRPHHYDYSHGYDEDDYSHDETDWAEEDGEDDYDEEDVEYDDGLYEYYYDPFPEYDHYPYGCYDAPAFPQPLGRHEVA